MEDDPSYEIEVTRETDPGDFDEQRLRTAVVLALARHDCTAAQLSVALVDDARISRLNEQYLGHAGATDVLSFDLAESDRDGLDGQIVVSVDAARRQAGLRGHSVEAELVLYCLHGTLHLLGYDDADPDEAERMHRTEDELLTELGFGAVYGARR
jgi:probable rRNA maturation factor